MEHKIDATDRPIGRVATEAAIVLRGKNTVQFQRNIAPSVKVEIVNASKATGFNPKKMQEKTYKRFSGYPGGLKIITMERIIEKKGYGEVFRKAVYGMLPANKLRKIMMKNLTVAE
ncbi:MAG: 50S ribosomal protein L13 [Patescibacteria group bacterium]|nr:MAG: 50S ribosomal protein L13 [Patescibacteria group bacterium]